MALPIIQAHNNNNNNNNNKIHIIVPLCLLPHGMLFHQPINSLICWSFRCTNKDNIYNNENIGLILGLCPANERRRYKVTPGANLESALKIYVRKFTSLSLFLMGY